MGVKINSDGPMTTTRRKDPVAYVSGLIGQGQGQGQGQGNEDQQTITELIRVYGQWAAYPEALEARRMALHAMLGHASTNVALESVLTAVDADQTRREQDPMWRDLVGDMATFWNAATFSLGRDRLYTEERSKPHDLLLESLAQAAPEKLADVQRTQLTSDLIDLYPGLKPAQKSTVDRALAKLGGADLVEILAGRGLGQGQEQNSKLNVVADRNRAIEAARTIRLPPVGQDDDDTPPAESPPKQGPPH